MSEAEAIRAIYREICRPLEPEPTGQGPKLNRLTGIRAVIWDVYGTLICSGVGDIGIDCLLERGSLIRELLVGAGLRIRDGEDETIGTRFNELIVEDHARRRRNGIEYPEVDIREIWGRLIEDFAHAESVRPDTETLQSVATRYECRVNPVWPYPSMRELLHRLRLNIDVLGIVSNAQFYTPRMLEAFLNQSLPETGFAADLQIWSFEHGRGKPDTGLFELMGERLIRSHGIAPEATVYIGNDMLKDIWAASRVGFRTVLFAGDKRSLRLREDDERCRSLEPDAVITELPQILSVIGK